MPQVKHRLNQRIRKDFQAVADRLPQMVDETYVMEPIIGSEAKLTGLVPPAGQKRFKDDETYFFECPMLAPVNHRRRMLQVYSDGGSKAVFGYVAKVQAMAGSQEPMNLTV